MIRRFTPTVRLPQMADVLRAMGCSASEELTALYNECLPLLLAAARAQGCFSRFPVRQEGDRLELGFAVTRSRDLARCLAGCSELVLFAATLGAEVDRLIGKYQRLSPARAVMLGGMACAMIEDVCDDFCHMLSAEFGRVRPRFSCGYGDLPLSLQQDICRALATDRTIGVCLTEGDLMVPTKTVTAVVGIEQQEG